MTRHRFLFAAFILLLAKSYAQQIIKVDVCVYGASSAGIIAAYTAKKLNKTVILVSEPDHHFGGLTAGGLGFTDIGNKYAVTGLGLDFYRRMGKHYGKFESWIFEPKVAHEIFTQYVNSAKVDYRLNTELVNLTKEDGYIRELQLRRLAPDGKWQYMKVQAAMFIDCSYEGDLMARAGVPYTVGREPNSQYNETYNGVQLRDKHQFPDGVDPYKVPGDAASGLLWGISAEPLAAQGTGDKKLQAYNYRICLSEDPKNSIAISKPAGYDPSRYELLLRVLDKKPAKDLHAFLKIDRMPNKKTDINNNGAFSTDMIGMNYNYAEADWPTREKIAKEHELYIKGLLYFIGHDPRMPEHLRNQMLKFGYPKDEYRRNGHWSPQMYVREARRMIGAYVMTQANCEGKEVVKDGVGMAAYTMDSHNCQRIVVNGMVKNEGDVQIGGFGPYPISYRSLIPQAANCKNLLVPVCLSASHIAYGSIRMEPVFMVLGQAAATAATVAIDSKTTVQDVDVPRVQAILRTNPLADGSEPEIIIDNADSARVKVTGVWNTKLRTGFGPSMLITDSAFTANRSVQFTPEIPREGVYQVYTYMQPNAMTAPETVIRVFDGTTETRVAIKKSSIQLQGQTAGEWVPVGRFGLPAGTRARVCIDGHDEGTTIADAVLFVPGNR